MKLTIPSFLLGCGLLGVVACLGQSKAKAGLRESPADLTPAQISEAFRKRGLAVNGAEAQGIRPNVLLALAEARRHGIGNSKVDFAAAEIAHDLGLSTSPGTGTVRQIVAAFGDLLCRVPTPSLSWEAYYQETMNLWNKPDFMALMGRNQFHPVKISWEDIGRYEGSVWGDRISDVGIWVRRQEQDAHTAQLALSVRRDSNFRDKVLMVPADRIKIHTQVGGRTIEKTLPQRLAELGLTSKHRDRNVIVSNQFAIVPVPGRDMGVHAPAGAPPRAAFNFSIFPYGSTNYVITDVIEGSSEAIVGPGTHQMLYANIDGQKAPFTASRAEDRQDLLRLEKALKAKGMDVDVQRYYLIQIPLRRDVPGIALSNMGMPPQARQVYPSAMPMSDALSMTAVASAEPAPRAKAVTPPKKEEEKAGLSRVAIGHGEVEGAYFGGSGFRGARAEEPIRVTVVYFVTPVGRVTETDMAAFTKAFAQWDGQAIWGGSFVVKE